MALRELPCDEDIVMPKIRVDSIDHGSMKRIFESVRDFNDPESSMIEQERTELKPLKFPIPKNLHCARIFILADTQEAFVSEIMPLLYCTRYEAHEHYRNMQRLWNALPSTLFRLACMPLEEAWIDPDE